MVGDGDADIPEGGSVAADGSILDANGNPVLGADGKPMVADDGMSDEERARAAALVPSWSSAMSYRPG